MCTTKLHASDIIEKSMSFIDKIKSLFGNKNNQPEDQMQKEQQRDQMASQIQEADNSNNQNEDSENSEDEEKVKDRLKSLGYL